MEKTNWIVVLVVGALVGFCVGHFTAGPSVTAGGPGAAPTAMANNNGGDVGKTPADLPANFIKESDFPPGTFAGLSEQQKYSVLKATNEVNCDCGCQNDSVAKCRTHDPNCTTAPAKLTEAINLAKQGLGAAQIEQRMKGGGQKQAPTRPSDDPTIVYKVPTLDSPVRGNADAKVTIVEFSDFQCPFCSRAEGTVDQVRQTYGNDVRIIYKQNPLPFHPHATPAAKAALAAGEQGKFWEMHDLLFKNQQHLEEADFENYAKQLGLNVEKWKTDKESDKVKQTIARDQALAQKLGASGTPAFFINGHKIVGAQPFERFKSMIDEQKAVAEKKLSSGTKASDLYASLIANGVESPPAAPANAPGAPAGPSVKKVDIANFNPVRGPKTAPVTIVEWSDFQCPFCSRVEPTIKQVTDTYGNKVKFVWRNEPLPFHPHAMPAAKAAMAAGEQGKFWEMHDLLFKNQQHLEEADFENYAKQAGVNLDKWKADKDSPAVTTQIAEDQKVAQSVGANGTPTFFINGKEISGAQPFESFKAIIDEQLKKAEDLEKKGVKPDDLYAKLIEANMASAGPVAAAAPAPDAPITVELGDAPTRGPKTAPVTIVEFSDFQCPFCGRGYATLNDVEKQYGDKVHIVFKQNPLPFHPNAMPAAQASLAAAEQGKFWQMYDQLFTHQTALGKDQLPQYAQAAGLDMSKFNAAMESGKFKSKVDSDLDQGRKAGVYGTPTFVIGTGSGNSITGQKLVGAQPIEQFKAAIDAQLNKAPGRNVAHK